MAKRVSLVNLMHLCMMLSFILGTLTLACFGTAIASQIVYESPSFNHAIAVANLYGADANPTGNPIGGGAGYNFILLTGDYVVSTADELVDALQRANAGQIVYIRSGVEIDLTNYAELLVAGGVTLAGDRGYAASLGPLLYTNNTSANPLINASGPAVRITGLRIRGADGGTTSIDNEYTHLSMGIKSTFANLEVDNCEIYNFSHAGVSVSGPDGYVHHNYIHHVRRDGLGYPVYVNVTALIEANCFDYYRHAIAASGFPGVGYEARYNMVLPNSTSHVFDMHGGSDFCVKQYSFHPYCTDDEWWMAGEWFNIHHNTFLSLDMRSILIRGVPRQFGQVHHNWFMNTIPTRAFMQRSFEGNVAVFDNVYGPAKLNAGSDTKLSPLVRDCGGLSHTCAVADPKNKIIDIIETPNNQIRIGFYSPLDKAGPLPVRGILPVDIQINHGGWLVISKVQVLLDDQVIFSSKEAPAKGTLQIDTEQLADRLHELTLLITDARGGTIKRTAKFKTENWLLRIDEFLPPAPTSSIFAGVNLSLTEEESAGWCYASGKPEQFFGDENRKTRLATTKEYLIYHMPSIKHFAVVLYTNVVPFPADAFTIYLSSDGVNWIPFTYSIVEEARKGNWRHLVVKGELEAPLVAHWMKVMVSDAIPAEALQLGRIEIYSINQR